MAFFITKIKTTGTNFSYRYLRLLQFCQNADQLSSLPYFALQGIIKSTIWMFFVAPFSVLFSFKAKKFKLFLGFCVCFCSDGINNPQSLRRNLATSATNHSDCTGSNLCHIMKILYDRSQRKVLRVLRQRHFEIWSCDAAWLKSIEKFLSIL